MSAAHDCQCGAHHVRCSRLLMMNANDERFQDIYQGADAYPFQGALVID
jgi:hypothetical protein